MELRTLIGTGHPEHGERSHGSRTLPYYLEQACKIIRDLRVDRQRRPLVLPEVQIAACEAFEGGWFRIR